MAGEKQLEQRLRMKLSRDKATYQTQLSRRGVALQISTDPKESAERRAQAKKDYERLVEEIKDLKNSINATERNINKEKARKSLDVYDPEKGKEQANALKEKYALLDQAYGIDNDPAIKKQMDDVVKQYKQIYTSVIGTPISDAAARSGLKGTAPSFGKPSDTAAKPSTITGANTEQKPDTTNQANANISGGATGGKTGGATGGGKTNVPSTPAASQLGGVDTATPAGIAAASARTPVAGGKTPLDTILAKTEFWYDLPDYIFKLDPKLGELLVQAVNEGWDNAKFLAKAQLTPWWQKNASSVRNRIVSRAKYDELKAAGEDVSKSDYGLYLSKQMRAVKAKAKDIAGVTLTDEQAQSVAQKIYDGFLDDDPLAINALITPFIGKVSSIVGTGTGQTGFGGQALQNYQTLQAIAKANGFTLKDILPNVSATTVGGDLETAVLQGLANGDIDINRVAQDARMLAAQGQPQYVRNLLGQGYDLANIYAPYRQTMAQVLELQPDQIDLNDNTLRMAITDKGDMNLFDFKKALRQDDRWQYTGQAKEEVSNAALKVLRDFGFQG